MKAQIPSSLFTLLVAVALLALSCQKSYHVPARGSGKTVKMPLARVDAAKHLYEHHMALTPEQKRLRALWDDAWGVRTSKGDTILVVAAPEREVQNPQYFIRRFFVFEFDGWQAADLHIVELVGQGYDVGKHANHLLSQIGSDYIKGYEGSILRYNPSYVFIASDTYVGGYRDERVRTRTMSMPWSELQKIMESQAKRDSVASP